MLNLINRLAHGFVAVPVLLALEQRGMFALLQERGPLDAAALEHALGANGGPLRVGLRLLCSLGWLRAGDAGYSLEPPARARAQLPAGLMVLYEHPAGSPLLLSDPAVRLPHWLQLSRQGWQVDDRFAAELLDGALLVPLLFSLRGCGLLDPARTPLFTGLEPPLQQALCALFHARGWSDGADDAAQLTEVGRHLAERLLTLGVTASYMRLLSRLPELLFGDAGAPFRHAADAAETHLDRSLNVVASGFQHEKYFQALDVAIEAVFNQQPFERQPACVADMGSGDGTLLRRIYRRVVEHSARGRVLDRYPLRMIAVDFNPEALDMACATLREAGVPHLGLAGDVGDPERLERNLRQRGVDPAGVLHVRSFLDHDRPYRPPAPTEAVARRLRQRADAGHEGVFVADDGSAIAPAEALQALCEHLQRWARITSRHGLLILEVHSLDALSAGRFLELSESLHFDALQGLSRQHLVEASDFLLAAAEAGLFARPQFQQRFPRTLPFCRITLNWFEARPYTLRLAAPQDLQALQQLEDACWPAPLRATAGQLLQRLHRFPRGQCVIELDGRLVAAIYTQRIGGVQALQGRSFEDCAALHRPDGALLQLLTVNVLPEVQHLGLGDQLLEFMLQYASVCNGVQDVAGVTRCQQFAHSGLTDMAQYVALRNGHGEPRDPVLAFHARHGARIGVPVPGWRPQDGDNQGQGVLVHYELLDRRQASAAAARAAGAAAAREEGAVALVARCTRRVLGPRREHGFAAEATFKDMGLDSLDLLELRTALAHEAGVEIDATFFFHHATPRAVAAFLDGTGSVAPQADAPSPVPADAPMAPAGGPAVVPAAGDAAVPPDAVAIVGIGCRFPGGADDAHGFWRLLLEGRDAIGEPPPGRGGGELDAPAFQARPDMPALRLGGWLDGVERFDAAFFGISPREAQRMDPQQRLLLEVAWQALEDAGIAPRSLGGSATGVFVGLMGHDYELLQQAQGGDAGLDLHASTGVAPSVAAGRLAYVLDLRGPALAVDTACSSALVALHLACRSLLSGESRLALAGGVNLILSPASSIAFGRAGMLGAGGRCRTFDAEADGYVRGEGCGVVVLKPLAQALRDGDRVYAVIRGSAVNQDGRSNGLTAPNGQAQQAVIRQALASADVAPHAVRCVEAHGTGTPLGDPVELQALQAVYGPGRTAQEPLVVGSVKTNLGHTEAAAGIAGLIKMALSLHHGQIPPHLHLHRPNPHLDLQRVPTLVPATAIPWPRQERPRLGGLSAFGYSGTNAHVILGEAPVPAPAPPAAPGPQLLTLSAHGAAALAAHAHAVAGRLRAEPALAAGMCFSANTRRAPMAHRLAVTGRDAAALADALQSWRPPTASEADAGAFRLAMLFTGQGAQVHGMGQALYRDEPVFREALQACDALLRPHLPAAGPSLIELLHGPAPDPRLHQTQYTQPALFAFEYALAQLWASWGIRPDAVLGHSVGEYVAACLAQVFSLEDALRLIAARGRLMQALPPGGAMASLRAPWAQVQAALQALGLELEIAGFNGPQETVVSGPRAEVAAALEAFQARGVRGIALQTSHAFHSRLLEPMLEPFRAVCAQVRFAPPQLAYVSNLTGALAGEEIARADYWVEHARRPVRFAQGVATLDALGWRCFLEVGPRPVLAKLGRDTVPAPGRRWLSSLVPGAGERQGLLAALGGLFEAGADIAWDGVVRQPVAPAPLPPYPFERSRHWLEPAAAPAARADAGAGPVAPLIGRRLALPFSRQLRWETRLEARSSATLRDHRVFGTAVVAAACQLAMVLEAGLQALGSARLRLEEVCLPQALVLPEAGARRVQVLLEPAGDGGAHAFRILSCEDGADAALDSTWSVHASGRLRPLAPAAHAPQPLPEAGKEARAIGVEAFHAPLHGLGLGFGPSYRWITALELGAEAVACRLAPPQAPIDDRDAAVHPGLLDSCFQALTLLWPQPPQAAGTLQVPFAIGALELHAAPRDVPGPLELRAARETPAPGAARSAELTPAAALQLRGPGGALLLSVQGVQFRQASARSLLAPPPAPAAEAAPAPAPRPTAPAASAHGAVDWPAVPVPQRAALLAERVHAILAHTLRLRPPQRIDPRARLFDLGLDSILALEAADDLSDALGLPVHDTALFEYPSLETLVAFLAQALGLQDAPAAAAAAPAPAATAPLLGEADLAALSEQEAERLLLTQLQAFSAELDH